MMDANEEPGAYTSEEEERLKKIEEELASVAANTRFADPADDDLAERVDKFHARAKAARAKATPVISPGGASKSDMTNTRDTGVALAVAYNVLGCTIGGWALGWVVDSVSHVRPMGQAIGALIGAVAGITAAIWLALKAESGRPK